MSKTQTIKDGIKTWKQSQVDEEGLVENLEFDTDCFTLSFQTKLTLDAEECSDSVMLLVPQSYPKGSYQLTFGDESHEFRAPSIVDALNQTLKILEEKRTCEPETDSTPISGFTSATGGADFDFYVQAIESDFKKVRQTHGWHCEIGHVSEEQIRFYLMIDPKARLNISDLVASAWGIDLNKYITICLSFSKYYIESASPPDIDCYQTGYVDKPHHAKLADKVKFGLYWTVTQRIKNDFLKKNTPLSGYRDPKKNYLEAILTLSETVIKNSPSYCIICGDKMSVAGLKPTVCEKQICIFSHEQYGLGIDLESAIKQDFDLVDLMITLALAASESNNSGFNPFNPFPYTEVKIRNPETNEIETLNFISNTGERDNYKVKQVLDKVPSLSYLQKWVNEGKLKENCDKAHPLMYGLLRWIMASNRAHLKKLKPEEQVNEMNTPHQYLLLSSPPEKERRFQELKKKYGSIYAFHGSALANWHSILRNGLKNMSNSAGMRNGAAYGSGIYLAAESGTSFGYMQYQKIWSNSLLGSSSNLGCLALCEIVNEPETLKGQPNPYYVIPNEDLVQTRYFLVYTNSSSNASVYGKDIKPPKVNWV